MKELIVLLENDGTTINLNNNNIGYAGLKIINEYLQRNKTMLEQKADTLNAEANYLCDQEKYSEAIEKYKAATTIKKELCGWQYNKEMYMKPIKQQQKKI